MDVYSFSMIAYQLFELTPPFSGMDPVDAARKAALAEERPPLMRLATQMPTMKVRPSQPLVAAPPSQVLCRQRAPRRASSMHAQTCYVHAVQDWSKGLTGTSNSKQ